MTEEEEEAIIRLMETASKKNTVKLLIDGEEVEVPATISVSYADILKSEVDNLPDQRETIGDNPTQFHTKVISNIRNEAEALRDLGQDDRSVFRTIATRYHPDLYQQEDEPVKQLAEEHFKALNTLREANQLKREHITIDANDLDRDHIVITEDDL